MVPRGPPQGRQVSNALGLIPAASTRALILSFMPQSFHIILPLQQGVLLLKQKKLGRGQNLGLKDLSSISGMTAGQ